MGCVSALMQAFAAIADELADVRIDHLCMTLDVGVIAECRLSERHPLLHFGEASQHAVAHSGS